MNCVIDIQEVLMETILEYNEYPSLKTVVENILSIELYKNKIVHDIGWSNRPLTQEQMEYASCDSYTMIELYKALIDLNRISQLNGKKSIFVLTPKTIPKNRYASKSLGNTTDFEHRKSVKILYSAVFLDEDSKNRILAIFKDNYENIYCDHVTLQYKPSECETRGLKIGEKVQIKVIGYCKTDKVTVLKCTFLSDLTENEIMNKTEYHITISTKKGVPPKEASYVKEFNSLDNENTDSISYGQKEIILTGIIGVFVASVTDVLLSLPEKVRERIIDFTNNGLSNQSLKFKPDELTSPERSIIHEFAKNHNIISESFGSDSSSQKKRGKIDKIKHGSNRRLVLTLKRGSLPYSKFEQDEFENQSKETIILNKESKNREKWNKSSRSKGFSKKILNLEEFLLLNIVCENSSLPMSGQIIENNVKWFFKDEKDIFQNDEFLPRESYKKGKVLIILRGLSGSGKSFLASHLSKQIKNHCSVEPVIASSDHYFINSKDKSYQFKQSQIHSAHEHCYQTFVEAIKLNRPVIIDNTNSTKKEYQRYINLIEKTPGWTYTIFEIHTPDRQWCKIFYKRGKHSVPMNVVYRMLSRFESDERSIMVTPFDGKRSQSFYENEILKMTQIQQESFHRWLTDMKFIHNIPQKKKTHLWFGTETRDPFFLNVPQKYHLEFLERYYNSGISESYSQKSKISYENKLIGEYLSGNFKMIFDLDFYSLDTKSTDENTHQLTNVIHTIQTFLKYKYQLIITQSISTHSIDKVKNGYHIIIPDMIVDCKKALDFRNNIVKQLHSYDNVSSATDWDKIVDKDIYGENMTCRMFGSKKSKNNIVQDDIHSLYLIIETSGLWKTSPIINFDIFKRMAIRYIE